MDSMKKIIKEILKLAVLELLHWVISKQPYNSHEFDSCLVVLKHLGKCCASFNRSLILPTWFIHVATADITTLINHTVRHAGRPRAWAGLTNLNTIFHLNNLALPQGRPTTDTDHWREPLLLLFL